MMTEHTELAPNVQSLDSEMALKRVVGRRSANVILAYSPMCGACRMRVPQFDAAVAAMPENLRKHFWAFNAVPDEASARARHAMFERVTGVPIQWYPTVIGLSKAGRVIAYGAPFTTTDLKTFLMALERT